MSETISNLQDGLQRAIGHWPRVAADTGLSYWTVLRVANGTTPNPTIETTEKLQAWLATNRALLKTRAAA